MIDYKSPAREEFEYEVKEYLRDAVGIAWDTCHKVYILMDEEQMKLMQSYEYDPLIRLDSTDFDEAEDLVWKWYDSSCSLRFIEAVSTNNEDLNKGFVDVVPQGWSEEEDDDY